MDDSVLINFMNKQTEITSQTNQRVEDMHTRLFGNGQPGALKYLADAAHEAKEEAAKVRTELDSRVDKLEKFRIGDRRWVAGALAVLGTEGAGLGIYFHYLFGKVQSIAGLLTK